MKKRIVIFASGSGSNAENIIRYFSASEDIEVSLIISNKPDAYVIERARLLKVPVLVITKDEFSSRENVLGKLRKYQIDYIVLAGFLLRVPDYLIQAYPGSIINIHPALLPRFGGKGMYGDYVHKAVVEAGEKESGITVHYVNEHYDSGAIIRQERCEVIPGDTYEDVARKVHELEYKYYPQIIEELIIRS
ncbi:phosphoribosylglycinamide formyltransferase [Coprobacter sp.]